VSQSFVKALKQPQGATRNSTGQSPVKKWPEIPDSPERATAIANSFALSELWRV